MANATTTEVMAIIGETITGPGGRRDTAGDLKDRENAAKSVSPQKTTQGD